MKPSMLDGTELVELCVSELTAIEKELLPFVKALLVLKRYHSERQRSTK